MADALEINAYMNCGKCVKELKDPNHEESNGHSLHLMLV